MHRPLLPRSVLFFSCVILCRPALPAEFTTREDTAKWFEQARFGIFVHWDPRSNVDEGSFDPDIRPETKAAQAAAMFDKVGEETYKWQTWNPEKFDANAWVDLFVASGAKYFTFTTVHMHGFCNFDSPATDFDIMSTVYKQDIVEQLARAAEGRITAMWYFGSNGGQDGVHIPKELWPEYYKSLWRGVTTYDQLRAKNIQHLITNTDRYGKVAGIWWDGGGDWNMKDPANRRLLPAPVRGAAVADYESPVRASGTPCGLAMHEQRLGGFNRDPQWEMCIPIESSVWFWSGGKEANTKDLEHCTKLLVMCASGDGNLLLNISPRPDGTIQPLQAEILRGMGQWLDRYGDSIYRTRGGPYKPGIWGGATCNRDKVYLHILQELENGKLVLPALPAKILGSRMLTGGDVLVKPTERELELVLDEAARRAGIDRIVELELDRDAFDIEPIETYAVSSLPKKTLATASSEYVYRRPSGKEVRDSAANVLGEGGGWTARPDDDAPWILLDMGRPVTFQQIHLVEQHTRIRRFEIQCCDVDDHWQTVYQGTRMNFTDVRLAAPVTARKVRVNVLETVGGPPQISRFDLIE
jgi:alpha-L-fucosidase